jgi:hypothetical protein
VDEVDGRRRQMLERFDAYIQDPAFGPWPPCRAKVPIDEDGVRRDARQPLRLGAFVEYLCVEPVRDRLLTRECWVCCGP